MIPPRFAQTDSGPQDFVTGGGNHQSAPSLPRPRRDGVQSLMSRRFLAFLALALMAASLAVVQPRPAEASGPTLPADFTDQLVTNVAKPTALAFTPDGRVLVT